MLVAALGFVQFSSCLRFVSLVKSGHRWVWPVRLHGGFGCSPVLCPLACSAPAVKSGHRWIRCSPIIGANQAIFVGDSLALVAIAWPNKSVKGTRRPLAVLKFWFLSRFGGFVSLSLAARPLP